MTLDAEFTAEIEAAVNDTVAETTVIPADNAGEIGQEDVIGVTDVDGSDEATTEPARQNSPIADTDIGGEVEPRGQGVEQKVVAPVAPAVSYGALEQAVLAGIPIEDARAFQSDESLLRVVGAVRKAAASAASKDRAAVAPEADEDPLAALPTLDPEKYEPEVVETFEAMKEVLRQQQEEIRSFREYRDTAAQSNQRVAAREIEDWFDKEVKNLGEDFADALGTGKYGELDSGSSQYANRDKIAKQLTVLFAGYQASGQEPPPREKVFDAAARLVLADQYQSVRDKKLTDSLAKRSSQHIQRAGGQKTKLNTDPLEEAAALLDAKYFGKK